jgi:hypothetical protein
MRLIGRDSKEAVDVLEHIFFIESIGARFAFRRHHFLGAHALSRVSPNKHPDKRSKKRTSHAELDGTRENHIYYTI